jgi:hypothetical protein
VVKKPAAKEPEKPPEPDPFIVLVEKAITDMLNLSSGAMEPKDRNACIANAIKLIQAKHKIEGKDEGGDFWGEE